MPGKTLAHFHYPFPFRLSPNCSLFASRLLSSPLSLSRFLELANGFVRKLATLSSSILPNAIVIVDCRLPIGDCIVDCILKFSFRQFLPANWPAKLAINESGSHTHLCQRFHTASIVWPKMELQSALETIDLLVDNCAVQSSWELGTNWAHSGQDRSDWMCISKW